MHILWGPLVLINVHDVLLLESLIHVKATHPAGAETLLSRLVLDIAFHVGFQVALRGYFSDGSPCPCVFVVPACNPKKEILPIVNIVCQRDYLGDWGGLRGARVQWMYE